MRFNWPVFLIGLLVLIGTLTAAHAVPCFDSVEAARSAHVEGRLAYQLIHGPKEWFKGHKGQHVQCDATERKVMRHDGKGSLARQETVEKRPARATRAAPAAAMTSLSWEIPAVQETALSASTAVESNLAWTDEESWWTRTASRQSRGVSRSVVPQSVSLAAMTMENGRQQKDTMPFSLRIIFAGICLAACAAAIWTTPKEFKVAT